MITFNFTTTDSTVGTDTTCCVYRYSSRGELLKEACTQPRYYVRSHDVAYQNTFYYSRDSNSLFALLLLCCAATTGTTTTALLLGVHNIACALQLLSSLVVPSIDTTNSGNCRESIY